jgi:hypothetical protein
MILSTHAVAGAALASLLPSHPTIVVVAGFASHFAMDAIPHWDYPLRSISLKPNDGKRISGNGLLRDIGLVAVDACAGLALAIWLFATSATIGVILLGAVAAMLPDPLQVAHRLCPREPLRTLQRFHVWIHCNSQLEWPIGVSSQVAFAATMVVISGALQWAMRA